MTNKSKNSDAQQEFKVPPAFKFQEGEKVLCFHGPLIYEAKCLQARYDEEEKTNKYHIHYSGWNKSWDEWVPETRVLKYNDGNIQKQKELHKAQKAEPKGKKGKKRSVTGKEKDGDGKEKEADDSRSSTPVNEKGGGKASASATQSSSQESASDIPKRKRSKLDPSVESSEDQKKDKEELQKSPVSVWKVKLTVPKHRTSSGKSSNRMSPVKTKISKTDGPTKKANMPENSPENGKLVKSNSPLKKPTSPVKSSKTSPSKSPKQRRSKVSETEVQHKPSPKEVPPKLKTGKVKRSLQKTVSPTKYPGMKGKRLRVTLLDINKVDEHGTSSKTLNGDVSSDASFGAFVASKLGTISDPSKKALMKERIEKILDKE